MVSPSSVYSGHFADILRRLLRKRKNIFFWDKYRIAQWALNEKRVLLNPGKCEVELSRLIFGL
jgi:hypothetical protein